MHTKNDLKNNVLKYILLLIPLYIYCNYKNGIILYEKNLVNLFSIFKIEYLLLINLFLYVVCLIIFKKKIKIDMFFLSLFIIPIFMPYNINFLLYSLLILGLIMWHIKFSNSDFPVLPFLIFILGIICNDYLNPAEKNNLYAFSIFDLFFGRTSGALGSTNIFLGLIITILLITSNFYKISICLSSFVPYFLLLIIFREYAYLFHGTNILSMLLLSPWLSYTPISKNIQILYGLLVGIFTFFFTKYIHFYLGGILAILICQFLVYIVCIIKRKMI